MGLSVERGCNNVATWTAAGRRAVCGVVVLMRWCVVSVGVRQSASIDRLALAVTDLLDILTLGSTLPSFPASTSPQRVTALFCCHRVVLSTRVGCYEPPASAFVACVCVTAFSRCVQLCRDSVPTIVLLPARYTSHSSLWPRHFNPLGCSPTLLIRLPHATVSNHVPLAHPHHSLAQRRPRARPHCKRH